MTKNAKILKEEKKILHQIKAEHNQSKKHQGSVNAKTSQGAKQASLSKLRKEVEQYIGSNLDPDAYGPLSLDYGNFETSNFSAIDKTLSAYSINIAGGKWYGVGATSISNIASFASGITGTDTDTAFNLEVASPVNYQFPTLTDCHKCALRSLCMEVNLEGISVTSRGYILLGHFPEAETYSTRTALNYELDEILAWPGIRKFTFSQIAAGGPQKMTFQRLSPLADQYKLTTPMSLTSETVLPGRKSHGRAPLTRVAHNIDNTKNTPRGKLPGAAGDNYIPTLDTKMPAVFIVNEDEASVNVKPLITITRTWEVIFEIGDSGVLPTAFGTNNNHVSEMAANIGTRALVHNPVIPGIDPGVAVRKLTNFAMSKADEAAHWAMSPEGKQTLKTAVQLFGTGVEIGSAVLPLLL